jgi:hypothetical protein
MPFELAKGDSEILRLANEYGFINGRLYQAQTGRSLYTSSRRLRALRALGYLQRVRPGEDSNTVFRRDPYEHYLTKKGEAFLKEVFGIEAYGREDVRAGNVTHDLKLREFHLALKDITYWAQFQGQLMDKFQFSGKSEYVNPDALFYMNHPYFVEMENSLTTKTKKGKKLNERMDKCRRYAQYYVSGAFQRRYGHKGWDDFHVLFIMPTAEKAYNFLTDLSKQPFGTRKFMVTTQEFALKGPLQPIWFTPKDFTEGVKHSIGE